MCVVSFLCLFVVLTTAVGCWRLAVFEAHPHATYPSVCLSSLVANQVHTHPTLCEVLDEAFKGAMGRSAH